MTLGFALFLMIYAAILVYCMIIAARLGLDRLDKERKLISIFLFFHFLTLLIAVSCVAIAGVAYLIVLFFKSSFFATVVKFFGTKLF